MSKSRLKYLGRRRRGSTLLIVIALLSVLILLAATLMYTSRLEVISSRNFSQSIQNNGSALTGVQQAAETLKAELPYGAVSNFTLNYNVPDATRRRTGSSGGSVEVASTGNVSLSKAAPRAPLNFTSGITTDTSHVTIEDLSGRVNVNTADAETLERLFALMVSRDASLGINPAAVASAVVAERLGPDNTPGELNFDDNQNAGSGLENLTSSCPILPTGSFSTNTLDVAVPTSGRQSIPYLCSGDEREDKIEQILTGVDEGEERLGDPRYAAFGDDRIYGSLEELLLVPGFTPELLAAARPYMTTFSMAEHKRLDPTGLGKPTTLVDLNQACVEDIYDALVEEYGDDKDDMLLRQFACNIVDWRDGDRRPTTMANSESNGFVIGFERTPIITEIYPDSVSPDGDGDDGEYIEIHNPWPETFDLTGWRVRLLPGGTTISLTGTIRPNGYLIITDDYRDDLDGDGFTFFGTFGAIGTVEGIPTRNILEVPTLDIPNSGRIRVQLEERTGFLVDELVARINSGLTNLSSYQRQTPHVHEVATARATPFRILNTPDTSARYQSITDLPRDEPFTDVLDLFNVFAGYSGVDGETGNRVGFPAVSSPSSDPSWGLNLALDPTYVDARIVDIFTVETTNRSGIATKNPTGVSWYNYQYPRSGQRRGLVNINTATREAIHAAGIDYGVATDLIIVRNSIEQDALTSGTGDGIMYHYLSDIIADTELWDGDYFNPLEPCSGGDSDREVFNRLTVTSSSFLLEGAPLSGSESGNLAPSGRRIEAQYALDTETPELVFWRFTQ